MPIRNPKDHLPEEGTREHFKHRLLRWLSTYHCGYCFGDLGFNEALSVARTVDLVCSKCLHDPGIRQQMIGREMAVREARDREFKRRIHDAIR